MPWNDLPKRQQGSVTPVPSPTPTVILPSPTPSRTVPTIVTPSATPSPSNTPSATVSVSSNISTRPTSSIISSPTVSPTVSPSVSSSSVISSSSIISQSSTTARVTSSASVTTQSTSDDITITSTVTDVTGRPSTQSMNLPSTTSLTRIITTGTDGRVYTVTKAVTAGSTGVSSDSKQSGFFQNKAAVAGTFIAVGLAGTAIILIGIIMLMKKRRKRQFERDVALTAADAARKPRAPPVVVEKEEDTGHGEISPYDEEPSGVTSDGSHGAYHQTPMAATSGPYNAYPQAFGYGAGDNRYYDQNHGPQYDQYNYGYNNNGYDNTHPAYNQPGQAYTHDAYNQHYNAPAANAAGYYGHEDPYAASRVLTNQPPYGEQPNRQDQYRNPAEPSTGLSHDSYASVTRNTSRGAKPPVGNRGLAPDDASIMSKSQYSDEDTGTVAPGQGYGGNGRLRVANE